MLPFSIQIQDGVPVSDQIIQAVRKAILTAQLESGDVFPSVRTLSQELRVSPTTAHKAVATLKEEGYLASRPGIGMVVSAAPLPSRDQRLAQLRPLCQKLLLEAGALNLSLADVMEILRGAADPRESVDTSSDTPHETDHPNQ